MRKLFAEILHWFSSRSIFFSSTQIGIWKVNIRLKSLGDWYWGVCSPVAQPAGFRITIINRERRATIILARDQKIFYNFSFSGNYVCLVFPASSVHYTPIKISSVYRHISWMVCVTCQTNNISLVDWMNGWFHIKVKNMSD